MRNTIRLIALAVLLATGAAHAQTAVAVQSPTRAHVEMLASETLEGRMAGSPGEKLAADYLVQELQRIGAKPLPGQADFRMPFNFTAGSKDGGSTVTVTRAGARRRRPSAHRPRCRRCRSPITVR